MRAEFHLTDEQVANHVDIDTHLQDGRLKDALVAMRLGENKQQRHSRLRIERKEHERLIKNASKVLSTEYSSRVEAADFPDFIRGLFPAGDAFGTGLSYLELGNRLNITANHLFVMKDQKSIHKSWIAAISAHRDLKHVIEVNARKTSEMEEMQKKINSMAIDIELAIPARRQIDSRAFVEEVKTNGVGATTGMIIAEAMTRGVGLASIEGICISDVGKYLDALDPAESEKLVDDWYFSSMSRLSREISSLNSSGIDVKEVSVMLAALKTEQEIVKDLSSKFGDRANQRKKASNSKSISITKVYSDAN